IDGEIAAIRQSIAAEMTRAMAACETRVEGEAVDDGAAASDRSDFIWIDDALPPGAKPQGDGPWEFVGKPDHPVHSGRSALVHKAKGLKQRFFDNAGQKLVVGAGDVFFCHVYLDPKDAPREVMLQWHTVAGWSHRAYWGANVIEFGKD